MRTLLAIVLMLTGAVIVGDDPAKFSSFAFHTFPGNITAGAAVFLFGVTLWLHGVLS
ncbi:MAG: hypothetical protein QOI34_732 [Verrucomicrobiota bacterium]|jgi:hypothetical protein